MNLTDEEVLILQPIIDKMMYNGHDWSDEMWDLWEDICNKYDEILKKN